MSAPPVGPSPRALTDMERWRRLMAEVGQGDRLLLRGARVQALAAAYLPDQVALTAERPTVAVVEAVRVAADGAFEPTEPVDPEALGAARIVVWLEHIGTDGAWTLVSQLESPSALRADVVMTELALLVVFDEGLAIRELALGVSARDVQACCGPTLRIVPEVTEIGAKS